MLKKYLFFFILLIPLMLSSFEFMKDYLDYKEEAPLPEISSALVYGEGTTEVTTQINDYENIVANQPIQASIFVTHDAKNLIDTNSFQMGKSPLKVSLVQSAKMSSYDTLMVTIYNFQISGLPIGTHTLPAITVNVGGKEYRALPLVIEISK